MQINLRADFSSRPAKPLEVWAVTRASVSVLTAKLDLPVPSGLVPLGHAPKVRPYRRAGYESEILSSGILPKRILAFQAECGPHQSSFL